MNTTTQIVQCINISSTETLILGTILGMVIVAVLFLVATWVYK